MDGPTWDGLDNRAVVPITACRANPGTGQTSVVLVNQEIALEILDAQVSRAIDRATLVVLVSQEIGQATSVVPAVQAIDLETSADLAVPATGRVILADQAGPAIEILFRTFRVAFPIVKAGRIGATIIATISATGGTTTPATSTIGSITIGGTTTTSTGRTTPALATGHGPHGRR